MLRLVCGARGPLPNALPVLATQLEDLGVSSYWKLVSYSFFRIKWLGFLLYDVHGDQCLPIGSVEEGCRVKVSLGRAEYHNTWIKVVLIC